MHPTARLAPLACAAALLAIPTGAFADTLHGRLESYQEVPALASAAAGVFRAKLDKQADAIHWELAYRDLESDATQAHIHFGQHGVNGGISVFLCTNLGNGPAGTPACPLREGTLSGTITGANVIGPAGQGIPAGAFEELVAAMRRGVTYVNVHTTGFPGGEIRAQLR